MLAVTCLGACPAGDPNGLVKRLTDIKIGPIQPIDEQTARSVADELVATVRCNAEEAARKVIFPAVVIAGVAAIGAGVMALLTLRHRPEALGERPRRAPYKRPKKEREPVFFVDPETGDVIELEHATAEYKKLRGRRRR